MAADVNFLIYSEILTTDRNPFLHRSETRRDFFTRFNTRQRIYPKRNTYPQMSVHRDFMEITTATNTMEGCLVLRVEVDTNLHKSLTTRETATHVHRQETPRSTREIRIAGLLVFLYGSETKQNYLSFTFRNRFYTANVAYSREKQMQQLRNGHRS